MLNEIKKRKMVIAEIMVLAFLTFKENFKSYIKIALIVGLPVNLILTIVSNTGITTEGFMTYAMAIASGNTNITDEQVRDFMLYYAAFMLIQALCTPLITMAGAKFAKSRVDNEPCTPKDAALASLGKGSVVIFAALIREIFLMVGIPLIFPWVFFAVVFNFFAYAIVLDDKGIIGSLKYSFYVVRGSFFDMLVSILFIYLMSTSITYLIQYIFVLFPYNPAVELIERTVMTAANMIFINATTFLYLNRKYLKEGIAEETD